MNLQLKVGGRNEMFPSNVDTPWTNIENNEDAKVMFFSNMSWIKTWNLNNCQFSSLFLIDYIRIWAI